MVAGKCPSCGNDYKNIGNHKCKAVVPTLETTEKHIIIPEKIIEESAMFGDIGVVTPHPPIEQVMATEPTHVPERESTPNPKGMDGQVYSPIIKLPWYKMLFVKKIKPEKKKATVSEIFDNLPKWSVKTRKPWSSPKNKNASWIQIVAFSRTRPPKAVWAEYDGVSVSVDDMFFPAPHDIRGDIFPYDMDKGVPLLDNSNQYNDMSYWNKLVERVKNMYFTLGLISGAGDFTKNIGLILLLVGVCILGVIMNIVLTYGITKDLGMAAQNMGNISNAVNNYIVTHP